MAAARRSQTEPSRDGEEGAPESPPETPKAPEAESPLRDPTGPKVVDGASDGSVGGPPKDFRADPELPNRPGFFVKPGRSITSLRGILGPTEEVYPRDFLEGQKTLEHLVAYGYVVEQK